MSFFARTEPTGPSASASRGIDSAPDRPPLAAAGDPPYARPVTAPRLAFALAAAALAGPALAQPAPATSPPAPVQPAAAESLARPADDGALTALAFALATSPAAGQLPLGAPAPGSAGGAVVEITLEVSAREVTFQELPRIRALPEGAPRRATWRVERVNLPSHLEPGVPYRDVTVRVFLVATPSALEALLADGRRAAASLRVVPARYGPP